MTGAKAGFVRFVRALQGRGRVPEAPGPSGAGAARSRR